MLHASCGALYPSPAGQCGRVERDQMPNCELMVGRPSAPVLRRTRAAHAHRHVWYHKIRAPAIVGSYRQPQALQLRRGRRRWRPVMVQVLAMWLAAMHWHLLPDGGLIKHPTVHTYSLVAPGSHHSCVTRARAGTCICGACGHELRSWRHAPQAARPWHSVPGGRHYSSTYMYTHVAGHTSIARHRCHQAHRQGPTVVVMPLSSMGACDLMPRALHAGSGPCAC